MKTKEEIAIKRGLYNYFTGNADEKVIQAMQDYATEAIKSDRERVKRAIRYPLGFIDGKIANEEIIDNLPIELK